MGNLFKYANYTYMANIFKHFGYSHISMIRGTIRENILRVLLSNPSGSLTQYRLAKEAGCDYHYLLMFLAKLKKAGLVKIEKTKSSGAKGRQQNNIFALKYVELLKFWAGIHKRRKYFEFSIRKPEEILKKTKLKYALTTYRAENLVQEYLFPFRMDIYINKDDFGQWKELLSSAGLVGKGNVRILLADERIFYKSQVINGFNAVCMPQLVVDLLGC